MREILAREKGSALQQDDDGSRQDPDLDSEYDDEFEDEDVDANGRSIKIGQFRISRDMLLLLGALVFLMLAVILTFLFPVGGNQEQIAMDLTSTASAQAASTNETASVSPEADGTGITEPYPSPADELTSLAATSIARQQTLEATGVGTGIALQPSPTSDSAYPDPVGSPPPQPTFDPARPTPTLNVPPTAYPIPNTPVPPPNTPVPPPTTPPQPTSTEQDLDAQPQPTTPPDDGEQPGEPVVTAGPVETVELVNTVTPLPPPPPTAIPADVLSGEIRWSAAQSPIILNRDVQLAPGAFLYIDPGVEIRMGPGVSFYVDGAQLLALGAPGNPVRFVSATGTRWEGLFGRPDSVILLEHTEISGGGAGGTLLTSERGSELVIRNTRIFDNGGAILIKDSRLEIAGTEITGNDFPYGAALDAIYSRGNRVSLLDNRIGGNRQVEGAPVVRISSSTNLDTILLDIQRNLLRGETIGVNLVLSTSGPFQGTLACNTLVGGNLGLNVRTSTPQIPGFALSVANNVIDHHTPPIIPVYLEFGIGRGAASEIELDMRNNWWGEPSGPYHPVFNELGRGDAVGVNIPYEPWLTSRPECAPPE